MKYTINNNENKDIPQKEEENENEKSPINRSNILVNLEKEKNTLLIQRKILEKRLLILWFIISFFSLVFYCFSIKNNNNKINKYYI